MKLICCLAQHSADWLTKLSEKLGHAAAAHRQRVVYGRLDNLPVARAERYGPLQRRKEGREKKDTDKEVGKRLGDDKRNEHFNTTTMVLD